MLNSFLAKELERILNMKKLQMSRVATYQRKRKIMILKTLVICLLSACIVYIGAQALTIKGNREQSVAQPKLELNHFPETEDGEMVEYKNTILEMLNENHQFSGSVLVFKNGQTVVNRGVGLADEVSRRPNTSESVYMMASIQKAYTAAAIMTLIHHKRLTFWTPLATYFPEVPGSKEITVKNLLDMATNLKVANFKRTATTEEGALDELITHIQLVPQRTKWYYETVNYSLLAGIVRKITNKSFQEYVQETLIAPLKLKHTGFYENYPKEQYKTSNYMWKWDEPGHSIYQKMITIRDEGFATEIGSSNMYTTTEELLTFYRAINSGVFFPQENLKELWNPHTPPQPYFHSYTSGLYHYDGYKLGHGLMGGFETNVLFSDDCQTGVIMMENSRTTKPYNCDFSKKIFEFISDNHYKVD